MNKLFQGIYASLISKSSSSAQTAWISGQRLLTKSHCKWKNCHTRTYQLVTEKKQFQVLDHFDVNSSFTIFTLPIMVWALSSIQFLERLWSNISSMRRSVSSPNETPRRECKIRRAAEYFGRTSRWFIWWWNTVSNAWYYISHKIIVEGEIKVAKMISSSSYFQTLIKH